MFNIGSQELVVILFVVLMLFGAKRIPEVARSVGSGMREFRKAMRGIEDELRFDDDRRPATRFEPRRSEPAGASTGGGTTALGAGTSAPGGVTGQTAGAPSGPSESLSGTAPAGASPAASGSAGAAPAQASIPAPAGAPTPHRGSAVEPAEGDSANGSEERVS